MNPKAAFATLVLLLAGCAGHGTHEGMAWRDGSWYSPARDGHGDYYTANPRRPPDAWDVPWAWSVGFVPYGGFCPAAYRYCTSFWADPWYSAAWNPWYYPFAYVPRHRPHPAPPISMANQSPFDPDPADAPAHAPRGLDGRPHGRAPGDWGGRRGGDVAPGRGRRRSGAEGGGE
jgi:hypothetical protein